MPRQNRGIRKSVKRRLHMAAPHVEDFKSWLRDGGYKETTIEELVRLLACWTDWAHTRGFTVDTVLEAFDASRMAFTGNRNGKEVLNAGALFIRHLQDVGIVTRFERPTPQKKVWPILDAFRAWMRSHRGIAESSLDTYQTILVDLLEELGDDVQAYTPKALRAFVLDRARPYGLARAKSIAVATRAFLRFLVATGRCPTGREYAVPGFASWRLTSVPGFLGSEEIERPSKLARANADCGIGPSFCSLPGSDCGQAKRPTSSSVISIGETGALPSPANRVARNGCR